MRTKAHNKFHKRILAGFIASAMMLTAVPSISFATNETSTDTGYADGELLVVYKSNADTTKRVQDSDFDVSSDKVSDRVQSIADDSVDKLNNDTEASIDSGEIVTDSVGSNGSMLQVTLDDDQSMSDAIDTIESQDDVAYVQPNYKYQITDDTSSDVTGSTDASDTLINDAYFDKQYYLKEWDNTYRSSSVGTDTIKAWQSIKTNGNVSVAVIDTGVDTTHPDLKSNLDLEHDWSIKSCDATIFNDDGTTSEETEYDVTDKDGHGTHVAGLVAAEANNSTGVAGTSYNAKIIPINVRENNGDIYTKSLVRAYSHLISLVADKTVTNLRVINMSLGRYTSGESYLTDDDKALEKQITLIRNKYRVATVCSAGNEAAGNKLTDTFYPSDYKDCISVTALNSDGTNCDFSCYNKNKDISAAGNGIVSTWRTGGKWSSDLSKGYKYEQGTSMSSPIVAGILALLWTEDANLTVDQVVKAIKSTANPINTQYNDRGSENGSAGAIDAAAAVDYVKNVYKNGKSYIGDCSIKLSASSYNYDGTEKKPEVTISGLTEGTDYEISGYSNNVNVGTAVVTVKGIGNYSGTKDIQFKITKQSLKNCGSIKLSHTWYTYDGKAKTPAVTIGDLRPNKDYTIKYSNNKNVGLGSVIITGIGKYEGTISTTFRICPQGTKFKKLRKYSKGFTAYWYTKSNQLTGYELQYSKSKNLASAKSVSVSKKAVGKLNIGNLKKRTKYYVRVRVYKRINGKSYNSSWSKVSSVKTR